jgi:hypothetical protein
MPTQARTPVRPHRARDSKTGCCLKPGFDEARYD